MSFFCNIKIQAHFNLYFKAYGQSNEVAYPVYVFMGIYNYIYIIVIIYIIIYIYICNYIYNCIYN